MEKSIEQILDTCAAEMQSARDAIGKIVDDSKSEGIEWPELDEEEPEEEYEPDHCICGHCEGNGCYICNYSGEIYR